MTWIRIQEQHKRFHAVFCQAYGLNWFYCGRSVRIGSERQWLAGMEPPAKCGCCASRVRHPFNVPQKIQRLAAQSGDDAILLFSRANGADE
jgi:hypothetical protein